MIRTELPRTQQHFFEFFAQTAELLDVSMEISTQMNEQLIKTPPRGGGVARAPRASALWLFVALISPSFAPRASPAIRHFAGARAPPPSDGSSRSSPR